MKEKPNEIDDSGPNKASGKVYCSLDIETSGFDPLKCEILEVGFAFFTVGKKGVEITKEWTQVFKPTQPVPNNILGLTGISQEELDSAPVFGEFKEFLQAELGSAVIVGHNVIFDIKFLEQFGITFSGEVIDTLDLVQFILPTHHSYNLENLMHTFGISHKDAHRALADSKAALVVLEKLLQMYHAFPEELKTEILRLSEKQGFVWAGLLEVILPALTLSESPAVGKVFSSTMLPGLPLENNTIYNFSLGGELSQNLAAILPRPKEKVLLVVPKVQQVLSLWKQGVAEPQFSSEYIFSPKKLAALLKKKDLSLDETKFLLKVLVWKYTNWQIVSTLELNLSFFGGQFKSLVTGSPMEEDLKSSVVCCDTQTFFTLSKQELYKKRTVIVVGLPDFEQQVSSNISNKVSWGYVSFLLRSIYNPELDAGSMKHKNTVIDMLAATDLFFGLVSALLQSGSPVFQYYSVTKDVEYTENFQKVKQAAENYCEKIAEANTELNSKDLGLSVESLRNFFLDEANRVRWIELSDKRCVFYNSPLSISEISGNFLSVYKKVMFIDSLGEGKVLKYFIARLGLSHFCVKPVLAEPQRQKKSGLFQGDLFQKAKQTLLLERPKLIKCFYNSSLASPEELVGIVGVKTALPAALIFGSSMQVKQFYDQNYQALMKGASLSVQSASGGSNKIFRNFGINKDGLLIAADKFILRHLTSPNNLSSVESLAVKTLVINHLPFEQFTHPYQQAVSEQFANSFEDFSLPKAVYNFHCLLKFFLTPSLEAIYLNDPKLSKAYAAAFIDYLSQLPGIRMVDRQRV